MSTHKQPPSAPSTAEWPPTWTKEEWAATLAEQQRKEKEEGDKYRKDKDGKPVMVVHSPVDL